MTKPFGTAYGWVAPVLLLTVSAPSTVAAQGTGVLSVEENFRSAPNGEVLARLQPGARVTVVSTRGDWHEVDVTGWVWTRSLQVDQRGDYALVVSEEEGENLRDAPQGEVWGRLEWGTLLEELRREPGWIQVRRRGFIWSASVDIDETTPADRGVSPEAPVAEARPAATRPGGFASMGAGGGAILTAPDGDTLAVTVPESELEVTAREGNWVRVRLEGWAWMPESPEPSDGTDEVVLSPDDLSREPARFVGRVVSWRLQFISVESAEAVRTDFFEGEPFLLCRFGGDDGPFVYVAVPRDRLGDADGLVPLEYFSVTGRVRTGASVLTGTPIVDLISLERERGR